MALRNFANNAYNTFTMNYALMWFYTMYVPPVKNVGDIARGRWFVDNSGTNVRVALPQTIIFYACGI